MKRPYLVNFSAIESDQLITIRASITDSYTPLLEKRGQSSDKDSATTPIQSIALLSSDEYRIKIVGMDSNNDEIYIREYDSDQFGNFDMKFTAQISGKKITKLQVYETSYRPGIQLLLGSFLPYIINTPKNIIISDFDKTLVDTKFHTAKEMIVSMRKPLNYFPTIEKSMELFRSYTNEGYQPFILSASPHFYENAIRDWLYQNQVFAGNILLKDYRNIFSLTGGTMTPKDLKNQGFYKLSQLVNILLTTGIPDHLILMGDGFESDTFIYLILSAIIKDKQDPWQVWNQIKKDKSFRLTTKQNFQFLSKLYKLGEISKQKDDLKFDIHIRCTEEIISEIKSKKYNFNFIQDKVENVKFYIA